MNILVTGATGFIGRHLVRRLEAAGHSVLCHGRSARLLAQMHPGRRHAVLDFDQARSAADWAPLVADCHAVINAVGVFGSGAEGDAVMARVQAEAATALAAAARAAGVARFVQISALGAAPDADTPFLSTKAHADAAVRADKPPGWTVVTPSLVYGPDGTSARLFAALAALPVLPGIKGGPVRPIQVDDLSNLILHLIRIRAPLPPTLPAVGPDAITLTDYLRRFRHWLRLPPAPVLPVPGFVLRLAGRLGDLAKAPLLGSAALSLLGRGASTNPAPFLLQAGLHPVDVETGLARTPATAADRLAARLYFLKPVLRLAIALLWIATGLVSLGLYPVDQSLALIAVLGVTGPAAYGLLYGAALADLGLGVALLLGMRRRLVGWLMIGLMLVFTVLISIGLPHWWLHPFGPITKNLPLLAATLVMIAWEERTDA